MSVPLVRCFCIKRPLAQAPLVCIGGSWLAECVQNPGLLYFLGCAGASASRRGTSKAVSQFGESI